ncbi:glutathione S-transferase [Elysia marginata]|uniref:glutathione transferase n=1 Tax=Elysia marginata TaxID=1093978 RepID=A0AAV4IKY8_9GAST|nr:glutathione S-transferase [Elysia marginata]
MPQTVAVCNYLARECGMYGKTSMEIYQIDKVVGLVNDFIGATLPVIYEKDEGKKAELVKPYVEEEFPKFMSFYEDLLKKNGTGYFVGSEATVADIFAYDFNWALHFRDANVFNNFPLVQEHLERIGSLPHIKAYVDTRIYTAK